ncbi:TetR/AcrR family transcriptional regulator [Streptomyces sp. NPDC085614]|uniref:TetR/AcrR family transcriptional regulator n=1 Tax=Streptomyces sp. NPDC085614 TaxID=3365733 RepID=UPI0037D632C2
MSDRVASGVFFTLPESLPRGRHGLSREEVSAAHRERLMIAATELMAADGYRGVGVREVCSHASVSQAAFYACFPDKDACIYAAYERFIAVLTDRLVATGPKSGEQWTAYVAGVLRVYFGTVQQDLVAARAFLVEMEGLGREARRRRREALTVMAGFICVKREEWYPAAGGKVPLSAYIGAVYALRQIACDALDEQEQPDLLAMVPEVAAWVSRMLEAPAGR